MKSLEKSRKNALDKIFKIEETKDYSLKNIKKGVELLGNPQNNFKIIHIAGTNGKGSVSKMIFSVLKKAHKKVGVFISPHLIDIRERFEVDSGFITKEEFILILDKILNLDIKLTYFDKCVLIAFEFFKLKKCEYVILEVGLGGKLDTTNIVNPILTSIVSIGFDHQNILGNTLEEIAEQKAGIIKEKIPLFLNFRNEIIEKKTLEKDSEIIFCSKKLKTNLLGDFQEKNAGIVYEVCKYLKISRKNIFSGLLNTKHNGRLQFLKKNLLIDGAHNKDSLRELKKYIENNLLVKFEKIIYCFSIKKGKKINLILDILGDDKKYILIDYKSEMLEDLSCFYDEYKNKTVNEIFDLSEKNPKNLYVVFGSLYMIGQFLK